MPSAIGPILSVAGFSNPYVAIGLFALQAALSIGAGFLLKPSGQKIKPPPRPFLQQAQDRTQTLRQQITAWPIWHGDIVGGQTMVYVESGGKENKYIYIVSVLAAHRVEEIGNPHFDGEEVPLEPDGTVASGKYAGKVLVDKRLGLPYQSAFQDLVDFSSDWGTAHRLQGMAATMVRLTYDRDVFPNGVPDITFQAKGRLLYDPRDAGLAVIDSLPAATDSVWLRTATPHGLAVDDQVWLRDHVSDEPELRGEMTVLEVSDPDVLRVFVREGFALSANGSGGTLTQMLYKDNAALAVADYLTQPQWGLNARYGDDLSEAAVIAAANACDEQVPKAAGVGTRARYTANGTFNCDEEPWNILQSVGGAMAMTIAWHSGAFHPIAGVAQSQTITLDENDLRAAGVRSTTTLSAREAKNGVRGLYISPKNKWKASDFPAREGRAPIDYLAADAFEREWDDLELTHTTSEEEAQALAEIALRRGREDYEVKGLKCKLSAYRAAPGAWVRLDFAPFYWAGKLFEVVSSDLVSYEDDNGVTMLGVDLGLRSISASVYDLPDDLKEVPDAPDTSLPSIGDVDPPGPIVFDAGDAGLVEIQDGTVVPRIKASWPLHENVMVSEDANGRIEFRYRDTATPGADWQNLRLPGSAVEGFLAAVVEGQSYTVQARATNGLGVSSTWTPEVIVLVTGKSVPPPKPDLWRVSQDQDGTRVFEYMFLAPPADVRVGGRVEIRFAGGVVNDWDLMQVLDGGPWTGAQPGVTHRVELNVPQAGFYTFAIKAVDSGGRYSTEAAFFQVTLGSPRTRDALFFRNEAAARWPQTKIDAYVPRFMSWLDAESAETIGDLPDTIGELPDQIGRIHANKDPIRYETEVLDLGADLNFTPQIAVEAPQTGVVVRQVKVGTAADGGVVGDWQAPGPMVGQRYVQFAFEVHEPIWAYATEATFLVDGRRILTEHDDVDTQFDTRPEFERLGVGHFRLAAPGTALITNATIDAIQGDASADPMAWNLIDKNATLTGSGAVAAEFKIYRTRNGNAADAIVDVTLRGPAAVASGGTT